MKQISLQGNTEAPTVAAAGPAAAAHILDAAADHYPLAKSVAARMAQLEVDFWQAVHHGRPKAARAHAARLCAIPQRNGKTEFDLRCASALHLPIRLHRGEKPVSSGTVWTPAWWHAGRRRRSYSSSP